MLFSKITADFVYLKELENPIRGESDSKMLC